MRALEFVCLLVVALIEKSERIQTLRALLLTCTLVLLQRLHIPAFARSSVVVQLLCSLGDQKLGHDRRGGHPPPPPTVNSQGKGAIGAGTVREVIGFSETSTGAGSAAEATTGGSSRAGQGASSVSDCGALLFWVIRRLTTDEDTGVLLQAAEVRKSCVRLVEAFSGVVHCSSWSCVCDFV